MRVEVLPRSTPFAELRRDGVRRVRHALRRLGWLVGRVTLRFDDLRATGTEVDKRCRVLAAVRGAERVAVTAKARSWASSIDAVASRVRGAVVRQLRAALPQPPLRLQPAPVRAQPAALRVGRIRRIRQGGAR